MAFVRIDWNPDAAALRRFGLWVLAGAGIAGGTLAVGWPLPAAPAAATAVWIAGAAAGLAGLSGRRVALWVYLPWMGVAFVLGNVFGRLALAAVFFGVLTPTALVLRLLGRDRLGLGPANRGSVWEDLGESDPPERYERQF